MGSRSEFDSMLQRVPELAERETSAHVGEAECYYAGAIAAMGFNASILATLQAEDSTTLDRHLAALKGELPEFFPPAAEPGPWIRSAYFVSVKNAHPPRVVPREILVNPQAVSVAEEQIITSLTAQFGVALSRRERRLAFGDQLNRLANKVYVRGKNRILEGTDFTGVRGLFRAALSDQAGFSLVQFNTQMFVDIGHLLDSFLNQTILFGTNLNIIKKLLVIPSIKV